ncbi:putative activator of photopigment and puc with BLUF domain protein [Rubellimicrobium mesophilum DSM 19309]|uniref:Putative activator of photopigment and puc with BLUF domain protein n=1 Tax=Rubellimicrobium mesophilum DSM 19309 TaxID=442562 RepID=A0A017HTA5_9RHOB|nr:BLUF domain-containing protein [Rubellimicrobium mesophilum]EYD77742.1 putative activator of photopigment and puc with BLUF domain protein [Rubellimicrobium mesophilum DSM 19309]
MGPTRLIYSSRRIDRAPETLNAILQTSRRNNLRDDITGVLIVSEQNFVQLLEGDRARVGWCLSRIMQDPSHDDIQIVSTNTVPYRLFPEWSMHLVETAGLRPKTLERYLIDGAFQPSLMSQVTIEDLCRMLSAETSQAGKRDLRQQLGGAQDA